jgi:hypothetical protein
LACDTSNLVSSRLATGAAGKNQVSDFSDFEISTEAVPESILITFSNIPPEIKELGISVFDWGGSRDAVIKIWDSREPLAIVNSLSNIYGHLTYENIIERVRQTGTITFPFVQSGHKYAISAVFANNKLPVSESIVKAVYTECVANGGIYLDKYITLNMNDTHTSVVLSNEPAFTQDIQFELQKKQYAIIIHKGDYTEAITSYTDDLSWDFEPQFSEHLKEAGVVNGDYPAVALVSLHIIHENISWLLGITYTPVFTYSF